MSEVPQDNEDQIGTTSESNDVDSADKRGMLASMSIFESMLLISLVFILLATVQLLFVLRQYSPSFPLGGGVPWSTAEVEWLMWF